MRERIAKFGGIVCVVVVLVGGHAVGLVCFSQGSGGPATVSQGLVTIGTDHSVYVSSDTITVTITNHLDKSVFLVSQLGHCPLIVLVNIDGDNGRGLLMNPCRDNEAAPCIGSSAIPAGTSEGGQFDNANLDTPLSDGTYQVFALYIVAGSDGLNPARATGIASPTFRVCTCRTC